MSPESPSSHPKFASHISIVLLFRRVAGSPNVLSILRILLNHSSRLELATFEVRQPFSALEQCQFGSC